MKLCQQRSVSYLTDPSLCPVKRVGRRICKSVRLQECFNWKETNMAAGAEKRRVIQGGISGFVDMLPDGLIFYSGGYFHKLCWQHISG